MALPIVDLVAGIFRPAAKLIDELHTSEDERLQAKAVLIEAEAAAVSKAIDYERGILEAQASVIATEAGSEHWLAAVWRPITMLTFLTLVVGDTLGILPNDLNESAWTLLQIGLGGYVAGRSVEKVVKAVKK